MANAPDIKTTHTAFLYLVAQIGFIMALAIISEQGGRWGRSAFYLILILWIVFMAVNSSAFTAQLRKLTP